MAEADGMPPPAPAAGPDWRDYLPLDDAALLAQCETDRFRASGPGGQKRNKTESAVRLRHRPTGLTGEAVESRSQHENRARALRRLRWALALGCRRPLPPGAFTPAALAPALVAAGEGRVALRLGRRDARYVPAVAELLDLLAGAAWRLPAAAAALGTTTAELGRFVARDPALWGAVQQERIARGLPPLRTP